jgi:hypothetical protein
MRLKYEDPPPIGRSEVLRELASGDEDLASSALIRMALHEPDWQWAEGVCLSMLSDLRKDVRNAALVALGHLARIHGKLHLESVIPSVKRLFGDAESRGVAEDTLEDIIQFVPKQE